MSRLRPPLFPLVLVFAGCATGLSGRYDLQTVNNETLPVEFVLGGLTALDLQLSEDGTCRSVTHRDSREPETDDDCTWTAEGTTITFLAEDGERLTATVANGTLTLTDNQGIMFVFVRRSRTGY